MKHNQLLANAVVAALASISGTAMAQITINVAAPELEEVFVMGEFIPDEKRDTSEIANVLGEEDMNLVPETTVGAAVF